MESTCSSHRSFSYHFWPPPTLRSTTRASKSSRFLLQRSFLVWELCSFQSILPTEKRVQMFQYLYGHPIQMTVYGHAISYGTIGKVFLSDQFKIFILFRHRGRWYTRGFCIKDSSPRDRRFIGESLKSQNCFKRWKTGDQTIQFIS